MGVEALTLKDGRAVLHCNTSGVVFGPIFEDYEDGESFLRYLRRNSLGDARTLSDDDLVRHQTAHSTKVAEAENYMNAVYELNESDNEITCEFGHDCCSTEQGGRCSREAMEQAGLG